jgi:uncharacterized protein YdaU (DUF1376 family)
VASSKSNKSPAFQFYPKDFLSSRRVDRMSMTERGIYITLLSHCWLENGLPADISELASACRMKRSQFERIWASSLRECFAEKNGKLINPRLERERHAQSEYRRKQKEKAEKRWNPDAVALPDSASGNALRSASSSASSSASASEEQKSAEPPSDSTPTLMTFTTQGQVKTWDLTRARLDGWAQDFPHLDLLAECRKARAWMDAKPERKKTARGMPAFLVGWFTRAVDRGSSAQSAPVSGSSRTAGNAEALQRFAERGSKS